MLTFAAYELARTIVDEKFRDALFDYSISCSRDVETKDFSGKSPTFGAFIEFRVKSILHVYVVYKLIEFTEPP